MTEEDEPPACSIFQLVVTTGVNFCMLLGSVILLGVFVRSCKRYERKEIKRYILTHTVLCSLYLSRAIWATSELAFTSHQSNVALRDMIKFLNRISCIFFYLSLSYYARNWLYVLLYLKWRKAALLCRIAFIFVDSILSLFVFIAAIIWLLPINIDAYPDLFAYSTQIIGYSSLIIVLFYVAISTVVLCLWRGNIVANTVVKQFYSIASIFITSSILRTVFFEWHQWTNTYIPCDVFDIICILVPDCCVGGCLMTVYYVSLHLAYPSESNEVSQDKLLTSEVNEVYSVDSVETLHHLDSIMMKNIDQDQVDDNFYLYHSLLK